MKRFSFDLKTLLLFYMLSILRENKYKFVRKLIMYNHQTLSSTKNFNLKLWLGLVSADWSSYGIEDVNRAKDTLAPHVGKFFAIIQVMLTIYYLFALLH